MLFRLFKTLGILFILLIPFVFSQETNNEGFSAIGKYMADNETMQTMLLSSGKSLNDLGNMEQGEQNQHTKMVTFNLKFNPIYISFGVPKECNHGNLQVVADAIGNIANPDQEDGLICEFLIPSDDASDVTAGNIIGFIVFGMLFLIGCFGILVEYTEILGRPFPNGYDDMNDGAKDKALVKSKTLLGKFFLSFSFSRNLRKTFWTPQSENDNLTILNGIRVISMAYILLGHIHEIMMILPIQNLEFADKFLHSFYISVISGGLYSVDVFFFMSSFLATYLMIEKFLGKRIPIGLVYFHRVYRLLPPLALFTGLILTFWPYIGFGPIWPMISKFYTNAGGKNWWTNLLFISNVYIVDPIDDCIDQLWYLSNDMQFFLILPFIVLAYIKRRRLGYAVTFILLIANIITTWIISNVGKHTIADLTDSSNITELYKVPYTRVGAYLVGIIFGMMYYEYKAAFKNKIYERTVGASFYNFVHHSTPFRYTLYLIGGLIMGGLISISYTETRDFPNRIWTQMPSNFFNGIHRIIFVLGVAFFFAGPMTGRSYFLRFIFGGSFWAPWAKLTFMAYLVHTNVYAWFYFGTYQGNFLSYRFFMYMFFSCLLVTYVICIPLGLMLESPFMQLERLVLFPPKDRSAKEADNLENQALLEVEKEIIIKYRKSTNINHYEDEPTEESIKK